MAILPQKAATCLKLIKTCKILMASSKPKVQMLYLEMDKNFGEQQACIIRNIVLYSKEFNYVEKRSSRKIEFHVQTNISAEEFCRYAAKKIMAANHTLLYGMWFGIKACCLDFHTLWNLSDYQDWEKRSWQFDVNNDVFISETEDDSLWCHKENGTNVIF